MAREEEIKQKAYEISQRYFPDSQNIWARQNIEAQLVQSACCEIVKWSDETMIEKACDWLKEKNNTCMYELEMILGGNFIEDFKKAMEE